MDTNLTSLICLPNKNNCTNLSIKMNVFENSVNNLGSKRYIQVPYTSKPNTEPLQFNPKINKIPYLING
jgi:hypothetical protein